MLLKYQVQMPLVKVKLQLWRYVITLPSIITVLLKLFKVNPPTAYNILSEFVDLRPGDFVIQNGANSSVGISVVNAEQLLIYIIHYLVNF